MKLKALAKNLDLFTLILAYERGEGNKITFIGTTCADAIGFGEDHFDLTLPEIKKVIPCLDNRTVKEWRPIASNKIAVLLK